MLFFKPKKSGAAAKKPAKKGVKTPKKPVKGKAKNTVKRTAPSQRTTKAKKQATKKTVKKTEKPSTTMPAETHVPEQMPTTIALATPREIREKRRKGWLRALITFELVGKPREHIEATLHGYVENVKNDGRIQSINEEFADALEHDDGMFSAFVEMEALVLDFDTLTWLAFNFQPASIEVMEPETLTIEARNITNWCNDLLSKLHEMSGLLREEQAATTGMTTSLNALIKNTILLALRSGERTPHELQQLTGIVEEQLEPFLKHFVEKGTVRKVGDTYALA